MTDCIPSCFLVPKCVSFTSHVKLRHFHSPHPTCWAWDGLQCQIRGNFINVDFLPLRQLFNDVLDVRMVAVARVNMSVLSHNISIEVYEELRAQFGIKISTVTPDGIQY